MSVRPGNIAFADLLLLILVTFVWGGNFSGIKLGLGSVDPLVLATLRFVFCVFPMIFIVKRPTAPSFVVIAYGVVFGVGQWGSVNYAISIGVPAGLAALLIQFSVFFTIIGSRFLFGEPISRLQLAGMILSLVGLCVLVVNSVGGVIFLGLGFVLLGACSWSACNLIVKAHRPENMFGFIVWSSLPSAVALGLLTWATGGISAFADLGAIFSVPVIASLLLQSYVTTLVGYSIWNTLLKKYSAAVVAPFGLLIPVFGIAVSSISFGDNLGASSLIPMSLIVFGIGLFLNAARLQGGRFVTSITASDTGLEGFVSSIIRSRRP